MSDTAMGELADLEISRDRDVFMRELIGELTTLVEQSVGADAAGGFVAIVGSRMGRMIDREYRARLGRETLDLEQLAAVLVDFKRRINGGFKIEAIEGDRIILVNDRCPFGKFVEGRPALCMMTSNIFGRIAAENVGHCEVSIQAAIARGDAGCRVEIDFSEPTAAAASIYARRYFKSQ